MSTPTIILLSILTLSAIITLILQFRPLRSIIIAGKRQNANSSTESLPPASVVIYASAASSRLPELLESVMTQDYPGKFEVIVVNDGDDSLTDDVLLFAESRWPNLSHTFTPSGTRNLSPRKLALTLGIKAAKNEIIVHTTADTRPTSPQWLTTMITPFLNNDIEIVIGTSMINEPASTSGVKGANRSHFNLMENVVIVDAALHHRAFSGDANNLAYRRKLFFEKHGFSESLDIFYGDDDIFVNSAANPDNTAAVVANDSIVNVVGNEIPAYYNSLRLRRAFTSPRLKSWPRVKFNLSIISLYLWLASTVALIMISATDIVVQCINLVIALGMWTTLFTYWNRAAIHLKSRPLRIGLPWFLFTLPYRKLYYRMKCRSVHNAQISWQSIKH